MARLFPLYEAVDATKPLGIPMCQNRLAVPAWSYAMEIYPPARVIEIGSYNGGFACALGIHASRIGARVVGFDRMEAPSIDLRPLAAFLGVEFRQRDIWEAEGEIADLIRQPGVSYVLCDGGDKPRELATFASYAKAGDVVAAHDYHVEGSQNTWWGWGEIGLADGAAAAAAHGLNPWLQDHFDMAAWLVYRKPPR